jgi:hypothetical protein
MAGNAPARILTSADRLLLEVAARLLAKFQAGWLTGTELSTLSPCYSELGWTPASRSRVAAPKAEERADRFAEFPF